MRWLISAGQNLEYGSRGLDLSSDVFERESKRRAGQGCVVLTWNRGLPSHCCRGWCPCALGEACDRIAYSVHCNIAEGIVDRDEPRLYELCIHLQLN